VVVLDLGAELAEVARVSAASLGGQPVAFAGAFVTSDRLLLVTQGRQVPEEPDRLLDLDLRTGANQVLLSSDPFTLGAVRCPGDCGICFVADAGRCGVHRYHLDEGTLVRDGQITTDDQTGLPPRSLGVY
jgi:hypothetical protein